MFFYRRNEDQSNLQIDNFILKKVQKIKYLGVYMNSKNYMHWEINEIIASGIKCYQRINKLLKSKLLSRNSKTTLYWVILIHNNLYIWT